jgi:hypothetical protein
MPVSGVGEISVVTLTAGIDNLKDSSSGISLLIRWEYF